jgi:hypothetical protein
MRTGASGRRALAAAAVAALVPAAVAVTEPAPDPVALDLYEWMGVSPIVVAADVTADDGKFVIAIVKAPIKGDLAAGSYFEIDQKAANRDREEGVKALDLLKGRSYLLLLTPSSRGKHELHSVYDLVRGLRGAMPLPVEGSAATIDAATRLAAVQVRHDEGFLWSSLPEFLQDPNPVLVDAALDLYLKFRREGTALVPAVEPLLEHPRPDFRRRAAILLGRSMAKAAAGELPERAELVAALTSRARRDDDVSVRTQATAALAVLHDAGIDETLRAIARDDPDQTVRFEAEKAVYERALAAPARRSD